MIQPDQLRVPARPQRAVNRHVRPHLISRAILLACLLFFLTTFPTPIGAAEQTPLVLWVEAEGPIEPGLEAYLRRVFDEAERKEADWVVIELTTLGGFVDAAMGIRDAIIDSEVPVAVWVRSRALSAGVLVSIAADRLYMSPGSSIGAAEPRPADEKTITAWTAELRDTAERRNRDPQIAAAMADQRVVIEGLVGEGELLTLTSQEALEHGFIEGIADNRQELLASLQAPNAQVETVQETGAERLARWVTGPVTAPILLAIGMIGFVAELFVPGFGIPGAIGAISLALYFGGHLLAGFGGWEAVAMFLLGIVGLAVEIFLPGFGIFGLAGIVLFLLSIIVVSPSPQQALQSILISLFLVIVAVVLLWRYVGFRSGLLRRLLLTTDQKKEHGYVATETSSDYVGRTGTVQTYLHPAGTVLLDDGRRVDAVSEGEFVPVGERVEIVDVQGMRIVVRRVRRETASPEQPDGNRDE